MKFFDSSSLHRCLSISNIASTSTTILLHLLLEGEPLIATWAMIIIALANFPVDSTNAFIVDRETRMSVNHAHASMMAAGPDGPVAAFAHRVVVVSPTYAAIETLLVVLIAFEFLAMLNTQPACITWENGRPCRKIRRVW